MLRYSAMECRSFSHPGVEAMGLDLVIKGWGRASVSDEEIIERAAMCFDGLHRQLRK
jgi:hypothetical protein